MKPYPLKEKIKEVLELRNKRSQWLIAELEKSESWFHKLQDIGDLQLKTLVQLSDALEYDFVLDYYRAISRPIKVPGGTTVLYEPEVDYKESDKNITLTLRGSDEIILSAMRKMLKEIVK